MLTSTVTYAQVAAGQSVTPSVSAIQLRPLFTILPFLPSSGRRLVKRIVGLFEGRMKETQRKLIVGMLFVLVLGCSKSEPGEVLRTMAESRKPVFEGPADFG